MDKKVGLDGIEDLVDSRFRFVLLAAHRAQQLMKGARPRSDAKGLRKPRVAMNEVLSGQVKWGYGAAPEDGAGGASASDPGVN